MEISLLRFIPDSTRFADISNNLLAALHHLQKIATWPIIEVILTVLVE